MIKFTTPGTATQCSAEKLRSTQHTFAQLTHQLQDVIRSLGFALLLVCLLSMTGCKSYPAMDEVQSALSDSAQLTVLTDANGIHFIPNNPTSDLGIIFYPGASVDPAAYAPMMRALAETGLVSVIAKFPLNLAILASNKADQIRAQYQNRVSRWVLGGHSLGGAMAIRYVKQFGPTDTALPGLFLLAAYPSDQDEISSFGLRVLSISASEDGLTTANEIDASRLLLPTHTQFRVIQGGNHAQFGWYGEQSGDNPALIERSEQQQQVVAAVKAMLDTVK